MDPLRLEDLLEYSKNMNEYVENRNEWDNKIHQMNLKIFPQHMKKIDETSKTELIKELTRNCFKKYTGLKTVQNDKLEDEKLENAKKRKCAF